MDQWQNKECGIQELWEMHKDLDVVAGIKNKRLVWIGHVVGMGHGS